MNTKSLARAYQTLTPLERASTLLAAEARGDEVEERRLRDSAPLDAKQVRFVPEHQFLILGLNILALTYLNEQLDALANHMLATGEIMAAALSEGSVHPDADWVFVAQTSAYFFVCNAEAWRRFCAELAIDPDQLVSGNYRGLILQLGEEGMQKVAPSRDALISSLEAQGRSRPRSANAGRTACLSSPFPTACRACMTTIFASCPT